MYDCAAAASVCRPRRDDWFAIVSCPAVQRANVIPCNAVPLPEGSAKIICFFFCRFDRIFTYSRKDNMVKNRERKTMSQKSYRVFGSIRTYMRGRSQEYFSLEATPQKRKRKVKSSLFRNPAQYIGNVGC